ncbi:PQQ-binding-like beta-propeller repeat protein [Nonomuraea sp. PA05]|uniref:caspase, EACC1-associated type n=1 Tax=Nonomuraea sp. PA05 TaxID=2604466 RepID=UPI0011D67D38|nr:caspase family protein [Nonomuraea sp. PA05]TYB61470.1 PQQ-binding-like beta-propeller repeat protein [Nonomuraea sp. PA05]
MRPPGEPPELLLSRPGTRVLLAGSGSYVAGSRLTPVPAVERTVADLGRFLVERAGLAESGLTVLVDPGDPKEFGAALVSAAEGAEDVLVLYYVGHGLVSPRGELHLATRATVDLTKGIPGHQALPYSTVAEVLSGCRAPLVLVVLDCCFAGRADGVRPALDEAFAATQQGGYLLTAAGRDKRAWAPEGAEHTAFSGALIRVLAEGDPAAGPYLGVEEAYQAVARLLTEQRLPAPRRQSGWPARVRPLVANVAGSGAHGEFSPYRGLGAFGPQDAAFFFGRAELTRNLADRVAAQVSATEPLIVVGPSGAGKTSLLRAGLVPLLERAAGTSVMVFAPGGDPVGALASRLASLDRFHPADLREALLEDPGRLRELLSEARPGERVIVVDQFEELFTVCEQEVERRAFLAALHGACSEAVVVLGLRADFYGRCVAYGELATALERPVVVTPMTTGQLREVIERPAELAGLTLQPGLADLLLDDVGASLAAGGPRGVLPLLSHVLLETWQRREDGVLTVGGYLATGGVGRALANTAETTLTGLDLPGQQAARRLLPRLVRLGEEAEDTRMRVLLTELGDDEAGQVLEAFVKARLLTVGEDAVELSHEALIRAWPRLREWIDADRAVLLARQQLDHQAREWAEHGADPSYLYSGTRLSAAEEARARWESDPAGFPPLPERSARFLAASGEARRRAVRARRRGVAAVVVATVLALVASVSVAVVTTRVARESEVRRLEALSQKVSARSRDVAESDPNLSRQLALAAYTLSRTPDTADDLARSVADPRMDALPGFGQATGGLASGTLDGVPVIVAGLSGGSGAGSEVRVYDTTTGGTLRAMELTTTVTDVAWAEIGGVPMILAAGHSDLRVWEARTGRLRWHAEIGPGLIDIALGEVNGVTAVAAGFRRGVAVLAAASGRRLRMIPVPALLGNVTFDRLDGTPAIVTGHDNGEVRIWNAITGKPMRKLGPSPEPGPTLVATGRLNGTTVIASRTETGPSSSMVSVWDAATGARLRSIRLGTASGSLAVGSLDGALAVVTGENYTTIHVLDAATGRTLRLLSTGAGLYDMVVAQHGGTSVIMAGDSKGRVQVWAPFSSRPSRTIRSDRSLTATATGQAGGVPVAVTADGDRIKVYALDSGRLLTSMDAKGTRSVTVARLGGKDVIAEAGSDAEQGPHFVRVWDLATGGLLRSIDMEIPMVSVVAGTVKGDLLILGAAADGGIIAWRGATGKRLWQVDAGFESVRLAFGTLGGSTVVVSGGDAVHIWDAATGRQVRSMTAEQPASAVTTGRLGGREVIVSGHYEGKLRVWEAATGRSLAVMTTDGDLYSVAIGRLGDDEVIVTGGSDSTVTVWEGSTGRRLHAIPTGPLVDFAAPFRLGGHDLIAISGYGAVLQIWGVTSPTAPVAAACSRVVRPLTREQWAAHVGGDEPYRELCP